MLKSTLLLAVLGFVFVGCNGQKGPSSANFVYERHEDSEVLFNALGKDYRAQDVLGEVKGDIYEKEMELYDLKMGKIKAELMKVFIAQDPKSKSMSNDEFLEKHIVKNGGVSAKEINDFAKDRKIPVDKLTPEMKERIKAYLMVEVKRKAVDQWVMERAKEKGAKIHLPKPDRPQFDVAVSDEDPFWGKKDAKVTIVEFSDFQCPFCAKGAERIKEIKETFGKKVKIVFKHFPLPFHKNAKAAAHASMCAREIKESAFWKIHDYMFDNQDKLDAESLAQQSKKFGIDKAKFTACMESQKYAAKIESDISDGKKVFVKSTPTFFVNGRLISGARPLEEFVEEITRGLKSSSK